MKTRIARARAAVIIANAVRLAVGAGRRAFRAGRMATKLYANAGSPLDGVIASALPPLSIE